MRRSFVVDIGNSGMRIAEIEGENLGSIHRAYWHSGPRIDHATRHKPDSGEWLEEIDGLLVPEADWYISSVRRDAASVLRQAIEVNSGSRAREIDFSAIQNLGLQVNVKSPERVGVDRLVASYAASKLTDSRPLVVIQAGSAVTVDLLLSEGGDSFEGGAIVPGVPMMLRLLGASADQLPEMDADELTEMPEPPGKNTEEAMICGTASALVGGVRDLVTRYRKKYGNSISLVLSGGDGMRIAPYLEEPLIVHPDLVLQGLFEIAKRQDQSA